MLKNLFCDWVSAICKVESLPSLGRVITLDGDGVFVSDRQKTHEIHRTSSSTVFKIIQTGLNEVYVDGNIGRYKRSDNLFGYGVVEASGFLKDLLADMGMVMVGSPRFTRIDVTQNFLVGEGVISRYTHWCAGLRLGRHKPTVYEHGVAWGLGSTHWSAKIYDKYVDLCRHKKKTLADRIGKGIARRELTLRKVELEKLNLTTPENWTDGMEQIIMDKYFAVINKGGASVEELGSMDIPLRIENAIQAWRNGKDFAALSRESAAARRQAYRLRKDILHYAGVDIFQPSSITRLPVRVIEIKPEALTVPYWYEEYTRLAA
jgi:hypothetical protein